MLPRLIQPDAMVRPSAWPPATELAIKTKYELDAFQQHAVLGIHDGDHVFVTAKTGSGKTFVGEYLIAYWLARGKRVFYTTPIKSLSNQKYHDLKKLFPNNSVGILTGDIKMCPDADIIVMTAEILCNLLYKRGTATEGVGLTAAISLDRVAGIVMDEAHYIQDVDRGHVWEETLILTAKLKDPIQLVLLSATMPSAASLATWLVNLHQRNVWLLATTFRVVPLVHAVIDADMTLRPLLDAGGYWISDGYTGWLKGRKAISDAAAAYKKAVDARVKGDIVPSGKVRVESPVARLLRLVEWLESTKRLPALFFVFSRKSCERYAALMTGSLLDSSEKAAAIHIIDFHLSRHRDLLQKSPQYHQIRELLVRGIAFHHSGLQPLLKEIVEILFTRGYVRALFATETFSVGLNMPTKTVVFLDLEKFSDTGQRLLRPDEYIQMAGRAGRRGLDTEGLVLYEPMGDPVDPSGLKSVITGALPPLVSRMRFHYNFILRLDTEKVDVASVSYWAQKQKEERVALGKEVGVLACRLAVAESTLTEEQKEAVQTKTVLERDVATSVNAKRKKAEMALRKWTAENDLATSVVERYKILCELREEHGRRVTEATNWDSRPLLELGPLKSCLATWGIQDELGLVATEFNEGHPILGALLADSKQMDALTANETACVLAAFLQEKGAEDLSLGSVDLRKEVTDVLGWLDATARDCQRTEDRFGVHSPPNFWDLNASWVCVVAYWTAGVSLSEIAATLGLFEGNVQRALLRVANMVDEWKAVATLRRDLATLEKLNDLHLIRDELVVDSLYLRL